MEIGAHVWLRSSSSAWGWVPAYISNKEPIEDADGKVVVVRLTLTDDPIEHDYYEFGEKRQQLPAAAIKTPGHLPYFETGLHSPHYYGHNHRPDDELGSGTLFTAKDRPSSATLSQQPFSKSIDVDPEQLKRTDGHADIKLRNMDAEDGASHDLIHLTHLHEPAILQSLRIRYDGDIIYTSTGPILIAINPFKPMPHLYSETTMAQYRCQGESHTSVATARLPPHVYQTADDAYRAMLRGLETNVLAALSPRARKEMPPCHQSILVSGESGAGKTVTTKIVLNYLAVLSKKNSTSSSSSSFSPNVSGSPLRKLLAHSTSDENEEVTMEHQVLQSNPILEAFGNARTIRNDNSSRFGKYIDVQFTSSGTLSGATIDTYLLEKVRLIQQSYGERNYHVFYQLLASATHEERNNFFLADLVEQDFTLLNSSGTYDRRDGVSDGENHLEMLDAMITIGFDAETIQSLMGLVVAILFLGNITFTPANDGEECFMDRNDFSHAASTLLGVSTDQLELSLITKTVVAGKEKSVTVPLTAGQALGAKEALIKGLYGAVFDFIVKKINDSVQAKDLPISLDSGRVTSPRGAHAFHFHSPAACIGVLDIFGFESFEVNSFEQICINYTNEALQQQFNKYVFKLEQHEYEKEGILWKFISFPDNQDVLDLIDKKHVGILSLLDEQCIVPQGSDQKFTRYLYAKCDRHARFSATATQRSAHKFSIEHYAGPVEYTTDLWLEKNKDQLPVATAELFSTSSFDLIHQIKNYIRVEQRKGGGGSIASKSVGSQFSSQLHALRTRIDTTVPHYVRCLKPNDDLLPHCFEPKNIVEQLRCGGVLEAVRVSRAGYPTRYHHEVFLRRYYLLGNEAENTRGKSTQSLLKSLIDQITYDVWEADLNLIKSLRAAAKYAASSPPKRTKSKVVSRNQSVSQVSNQLKELQDAYDGAVFPETKDGFLSLDFPARCAIAGIQMGKTKVFLRREAFDRIESMRSGKISGAAAMIQARVRGVLTRQYYEQLKATIIYIQSFARMFVVNLKVKIFKIRKSAVSTLQRAYRAYQFKMMQEVWSLDGREEHDMRNMAALLIQSVARMFLSKKGRGKKVSSKIKMAKARERAALQKAAEEKRASELRRMGKKSTEGEAVGRQASKRVSVPHARKPVPQADVPKVNNAHQGNDESVSKSSSRFPNLEITSQKTELLKCIQLADWASVERILHTYPELSKQEDPSTGELPLHIIVRQKDVWSLLIDMLILLHPKALLHRDRMGALPIHHAAAHNAVEPLEMIYCAYKDGVTQADFRGRLPLHVAAEFDAVEAVKFLLVKFPDGAYTMVHRPLSNSGGGLPLHVACRGFASIGVITALLSENFASGKRTDENGDLPLHLILRGGGSVEHVVVKTLLTCFSGALSRTDMHGDHPLSIALKNRCNPAVTNYLLMQFPNAAVTLDGEGRSPLVLALLYDAEDRIILSLLNHAPYFAVQRDELSGLTPIQIATDQGHSHNVVYNLLKRDMPIDLKEKTQPIVLSHNYSWNHLVSGTNDEYHHVVTKVLQQCTQPQVLALAHVEGKDGRIALASATTVCRHEMRVMLRLFNSLEVVNQRPAYSNPNSDTQIFYALRFDVPPHHMGGNYTMLYQEELGETHADILEDMDDVSVTTRKTTRTNRTTAASLTQEMNFTVEEKLRQIRNEKGQQVIAKLTSRSDVVERELRVRKDFRLSRNYVPAILSVHHTVQHSAYSEAMAEPGYCIVLEGADTTLENMMVDLRKAGKVFPVKALKRIGIALLHLHEHGLIHGDFGTHNIGKFKERWKILGVGGAVQVNEYTDPNRGFYHPPEAIELETNFSLTKKSAPAHIVSIKAKYSYDMWAYGVAAYDAITNIPLAPYNQGGKTESSGVDLNKIARWDDSALMKSLKPVAHDFHAHDLLRQLLHPNPVARFKTMREVLNHPFFSTTSGSGMSEKIGVGIQPPETRTTVSYIHREDRIPRPLMHRQFSSPDSIGSSEVSSPLRRQLSAPLSPRSQKVKRVPSFENYENESSSPPQESRKKSSNFASLRDSFLPRRKLKNSGNTKEQFLGSAPKR